MAREDIRIVQAKGGWQVMTPGQAKTPTSRVFKTKKDAIRYALTTVRSGRVASKLPRVTSTRTVSSGGVKKNHGISEVAKERKPKAKTVRKSAAKSRSSKNEESPLARLVNRAQVEHDRNEAPGDAFRELLDKAANTNKAALDRLAQ